MKGLTPTIETAYRDIPNNTNNDLELQCVNDSDVSVVLGASSQKRDKAQYFWIPKHVQIKKYLINKLKHQAFFNVVLSLYILLTIFAILDRFQW